MASITSLGRNLTTLVTNHENTQDTFPCHHRRHRRLGTATRLRRRCTGRYNQSDQDDKNIISNDPPGRAFEGIVARDIAIGEKIVIPVGTPVRGIVKSPHFTVGSTSRPLTLRVIGLTSYGRTIAIETEDIECDSNSPWTVGPNRRAQITGDAFIYNAGTLIPFHLKQSVTI